MNTFTRTLLILTLTALLAACGGQPGGSASDAQAAQNLLPRIVGYQASSVDNLVDAITAAGGSAALINGNPLLAAAIARIDQTIQCYRNVGAVAANSYVQSDVSSLLQGSVPRAGVVAVINQERLSGNFMQCVLGMGGDGIQAQAVTLEPCTGSGTFVFRGQNITYIYAATDQQLCSIFQGHFDAVAANQ